MLPSRAPLCLVIAAVVLTGACSKSSSPTSPSTSSSTSTPTVTTYSGFVFVISGATSQSGTVTLSVSTTSALAGAAGPLSSLFAAPTTVAVSPSVAFTRPLAGTSLAATAGSSPVTGTLTLPNSTVALSGTVSASGALTAQGGGVSLAGTVDSTGITAAGTGSGGSKLQVAAVQTNLQNLTQSPTGTLQAFWHGTYNGTIYLPSGLPKEFPAGPFGLILSTTPYAPRKFGFRGGIPADGSIFGGTATLPAGDGPPSYTLSGGSMDGNTGDGRVQIHMDYVGPFWIGTYKGTTADNEPQGGIVSCYPD